MSLKHIALLFAVITSFSSCIILDTPGLYSGYKKLPEAERSRVVFTDPASVVCDRSTDTKLYAITGKQLAACLQTNDTSVVYMWSPHCHSEVCISMSIAQYYCEKRNYKLYVVKEYYNFAILEAQNTITSPVFAVNQQYYKTHYCDKYINKFRNDLVKGVKLSKEDKYGRFLIFKKDKLIEVRHNLVAPAQPLATIQK